MVTLERRAAVARVEDPPGVGSSLTQWGDVLTRLTPTQPRIANTLSATSDFDPAARNLDLNTGGLCIRRGKDGLCT
jgi:hypothetical protein